MFYWYERNRKINRSPQGPQAYSNGVDIQIGSSEQQPTVDFDVTCNGGNIVIIDQNDIPVTGSEKNNIKMISPLLSPEFLPQLHGMKLDDAAKCLGGCSEFLKCLHASEEAEVVLESTETVSPCSELPPEHGASSIAHTMPHVAAMQDMKTFNIKATHRIGIIQFPLSSSFQKAELEENISERLNLNAGNFRISYMDTEGDWILITCDKDL